MIVVGTLSTRHGAVVGRPVLAAESAGHLPIEDPPLADCLLPTAYCLLPTAHCPLPVGVPASLGPGLRTVSGAKRSVGDKVATEC